jgi:hypothetical protein
MIYDADTAEQALLPSWRARQQKPEFVSESEAKWLADSREEQRILRSAEMAVTTGIDMESTEAWLLEMTFAGDDLDEVTS